MVSSDGRQWINDLPWARSEGDLLDVAFAANHFVAVGGTEKRGRILSSADGRLWREIAVRAERLTTIAAGSHRLIATDANTFLLSDDGRTFRPGAKLSARGTGRALGGAFGSGEGGPRFVFIGEGPDEEGARRFWRVSTEDGEAITSADRDASPALAITYGAGQFVTVGAAGLIETSHDGQQWRRRALRISEDLTQVVWDGKRFVATAGTRAWVSVDGIDWSEAPPVPGVVAWADHAFGAFAFSSTGTVSFSKNFLDWTKVSIPPGPRLRAMAARPLGPK